MAIYQAQRTAGGISHALDVGAVQIHRVQLKVALVVRREHNALAVGRHRGLGRIPGLKQPIR